MKASLLDAFSKTVIWVLVALFGLLFSLLAAQFVFAQVKTPEVNCANPALADINGQCAAGYSRIPDLVKDDRLDPRCAPDPKCNSSETIFVDCTSNDLNSCTDCVTGCIPQKTASSDFVKDTRLIYGRVLVITNLVFKLASWPSVPKSVGVSSFKVGDFNADGCSDVLMQASSVKLIYIGLSNCRDRFSIVRWAGISSELLLKDSIVGDYNYDGYSDVAIPLLSDNFTSWIFHYPKERAGFSFIPVGLNLKEIKLSSYFPGSIYGDGRSGIITYSEQSTESQLFATFVDSDGRLDTVKRLNIRSEGSPLVSGHFKENVQEEILWSEKLRPNNLYVKAALSENKEEDYPFASFPKDFAWSHPLVGDFNGDGYTDIIVFGGAIGKWWIALSDGKTGLERPIEVPLPINTNPNVIQVGDFNGDSIDDLILYDEPTGSFLIGIVATGSGIAGVQLKLGDKLVATTGEDGSYLASISTATNTIINPAKANHSFIPKQRDILQRRTKINSPINFLGLDNSASNEFIGQSIKFLGDITGPYVCLGYTVTGNQFDKWGAVHDDCPDNFAFISVSLAGEKSRNEKNTIVSGICCRLPADDILGKEHLYSISQCPKNYIATGAKSNWSCLGCDQYIRCTKINTERYQLSEPTKGYVLGDSTSMASWDRHIDQNDVSIAARFGVLRAGYSFWTGHVCSGKPVGSVLTNKAVKCADLIFRQLQHSGGDGVMKKGAVVKIFPDCASMENIYDPTSGCRIESSSSSLRLNSKQNSVP